MFCGVYRLRGGGPGLIQGCANTESADSLWLASLTSRRRIRSLASSEIWAHSESGKSSLNPSWMLENRSSCNNKRQSVKTERSAYWQFRFDRATTEPPSWERYQRLSIWGQLSRFWGKLCRFWGKLCRLWGKLCRSGGQLCRFLGQLCRFWGQLCRFWGQLCRLWGKLGRIRGQLCRFWGQLCRLWGRLCRLWG